MRMLRSGVVTATRNCRHYRRQLGYVNGDLALQGQALARLNRVRRDQRAAAAALHRHLWQHGLTAVAPKGMAGEPKP